MKIYANQLPNQLQKGLGPCYLLFGDEPFQIDDGRKQIKIAAKAAGFEEVIRLTQDDQFQWQDLVQHFQAMSLFSEQKLIELELTNNKIGKEGADVLKQIAENFDNDTVLVLFGAKLDASQTKSAWFKALDSKGVYVPVYDIDGNHLNKWLQQQLNTRSMRMSPDAAQYLLQFTIGNLLATAQELDKLLMALGNETVYDLNIIQRFVADQSKYSVFQLMDAIWAQQSEKAVTILSRLKAEEFEPNILFWSFQKDVLLIHELQIAGLSQLPTKDVFARYRLWQSKQKQFERVAQLIPSEVINDAIDLLHNIDLAIKRFDGRCIYSLFAQLALILCGSMSSQSLPLTNSTLRYG